MPSQAVNSLSEVLPQVPQQVEPFGRVTNGFEIWGRQRKPSEKSVRGSSATHCPPFSLVRGTVDDRSCWWWMRTGQIFGKIIPITLTIKLKSGSKCGITRVMQHIGGLLLRAGMKKHCLSSSKIILRVIVLSLGTFSTLRQPERFTVHNRTFSICSMITRWPRSSLLALFELASLSVFGCTRIVTCIPRSGDTVELDIVRNLGWCGFELTTLDPWILLEHNHRVLSSKWLFLVAEI